MQRIVEMPLLKFIEVGVKHVNQSRLLRRLRRSVLIVLAAFCLWYFEQGFYLATKLVTMA